MTRNSQHGTQKPCAWYALGLKILKGKQSSSVFSSPNSSSSSMSSWCCGSSRSRLSCRGSSCFKATTSVATSPLIRIISRISWPIVFSSTPNWSAIVFINSTCIVGYMVINERKLAWYINLRTTTYCSAIRDWPKWIPGHQDDVEKSKRYFLHGSEDSVLQNARKKTLEFLMTRNWFKIV